MGLLINLLEVELHLGSDLLVDCWSELVPSFDEDFLGFQPIFLLILMISVVSIRGSWVLFLPSVEIGSNFLFTCRQVNSPSTMRAVSLAVCF